MEINSQHDVVGAKLVASGLCLARNSEGEIVFVDGLIPGEHARVEITDKKQKTNFATVLQVTDVSSHRVDPPCEFVNQGCGGCDWQHIDVKSQPFFKRDIVVDALTRIGHIENAEDVVEVCREMNAIGYRCTAEVLIENNSWGFRRRHSHEIVNVDHCLVLHPECEQQVLDTSKEYRGELAEVHVRRHPDPLEGVLLNVSEKSFFQSHIEAPSVLIEMIRNVIGPTKRSLRCVDLYGGVGIFSLALAQDGHDVVSVEGNPHAVRDAKKNLVDYSVSIIESDVKNYRYKGRACDVVVADPSREGLGKDAIGAVVSCDAPLAILVSCDPAAGARDVGLLCDRGYSLDKVTPIDMFPHTHHVEMVSVLRSAT